MHTYVHTYNIHTYTHTVHIHENIRTYTKPHALRLFCTSVVFVIVEMEDTLHKVLVKHGGVPGEEKMAKAELSCGNGGSVCGNGGSVCGNGGSVW